MRIAIVVSEEDERTGRIVQVVSHGVDLETGESFAMSQESPVAAGLRMDHETGLYVIEETSHEETVPVPRLPSFAIR